MSESPALRTARRRYLAVSALFWLPIGLAFAPAVLLFTERGMSLTAVAAFFAAHSLTAAALELPTGGLSDVLGRRSVLAAAGLLDVVALMLLGLGSSYAAFAVGMGLKGVARALSSGPGEAWYVDTVQAHSGPDADLRTGLSRGGAATSAALAAGTLVGGAVPWLLGLGPDLGARLSEATGGVVLPLSVPVLAGAAVSIVFVVYVLTMLREPPRKPATPSSVLRGVPATICAGLRLSISELTVRRVLLSAGAAGAALATVELLMPGRAAGLTGTAESGAVLFAALACAGFATSGLGSALAPLAARLTRSGEHAVLAGLGVSAGGLLLLGVTATSSGPLSLVVAVGGFILFYLGLGAASPNENELLHHRVSSEQRATALSVQSLAQQLVYALSGLAVSALPVGPLPWLFGSAALLAGAALWIRRPAPVPAPVARIASASPVDVSGRPGTPPTP
ncbi:MFS transporter [Streptomyces sp. NPDC021093]|uniref:MFS transporter n=1 Tax=Streptomyces sp. NPDC021093 TaxID=3365112 RepID=UPI0037ACB7CD